MRLVEFEIGKGATLEDAVIWGTSPLKEYLKILDEQLDISNDSCPMQQRLLFLYAAMEDKLDELEEYLMKYDQYVRELGKRRANQAGTVAGR